MSIFHLKEGLLGRFRRGEPGALSEVYRFYAGDLFQLIRGSFVRRAGKAYQESDLLDVVQETFVRAFSPKARQSFDADKLFRPYLNSIARNVWIDVMRGESRAITYPDEQLIDLAGARPASEDPWPWETPAVEQAVRQFLSQLPPDLASVHRYRYVDGLSQAETASAMGRSRQNVRTMEERLKTSLASALGIPDGTRVTPSSVPSQPSFWASLRGAWS